MNTADMPAKPHHGKNIKRIREILGMKQEALAIELGNDWTQRRISLLEQKEDVEEDILEEVAKALRVSSDAIKGFNEEAAVNIFANNYDGHDNSSAVNFQCTFNPFEKIVQLYEEKIALYERMLKDKEEMLAKMAK
jgi:transcriptional regulator with XRE-family HTH domain